MRLVMVRAALLVLFATVCVLPSHAAVPAFQPRGAGDIYLALGDSLAVGYEEAGNNDGQPGYPAVLHRYLRSANPGLQVHSGLARIGETSATMVTDEHNVSSQITRAQEYIAEQRAIGKRVGLITVSIGMAEVINIIRSRSDRTATLASFKTRLELICDRLLGAMKNRFGVQEGDLVLVSLYNPYPGLTFPNKGKIADELVPEFNAIIAEVAQARGNLPVADLTASFVGREAAFIFVQRPFPDPEDILDPQLYAKLDPHPRPAGHRAIASSIMTATSYQYSAHLPVLRR